MKILFAGIIARYPFGGVTWCSLMYLLGLRALGHEVFYIEDTGECVYDPVQNTRSTDPSYGTSYINSALEPFGPDAFCTRFKPGTGEDAVITFHIAAGRVTGMKLKATSVTTYQAFNCTDCADRFFGGDAEVNGVPGFLYSVEVLDGGEPGNAPKGEDRFIIAVSNGYQADSGGIGFQNPATGQTGIDNGNIKIHKNCAQ